MKKKSYIYGIEIDHLKVAESAKYYSTKKNAIEMAVAVGREVFAHNHGFWPEEIKINENANPIEIQFRSIPNPNWGGGKVYSIAAQVRRVPVVESIEGKRLNIQWND